MEITRDTKTAPGPSDWFTGTVHLDTIATPSGESRVSAASVHFTPGARTAWHSHPRGQSIDETVGFRAVPALLAGLEEEVDDEGSPVTWGEHVSEEEYAAGAE